MLVYEFMANGSFRDALSSKIIYLYLHLFNICSYISIEFFEFTNLPTKIPILIGSYEESIGYLFHIMRENNMA